MKKIKAEKAIIQEEAHAIPFLYLVITPFILSFLSFIFYKSSLHYNFQFDDLANITKLFSIRHSSLSNLFFAHSRWISYWVNTIHYAIGKFDPFSYRLLNVSIHSLTSIIVFFVFYYALTGLKKKSFFTQNAFALAFVSAALFLLHPVQTQTVSYVIQGQLEGFAAFFIALITVCFLGYSRTTSPIIKYLLGALIFIFGAFSCGTKEIAIVSPVLLMVFDWFFIAQGSTESFKKRLLFYSMYTSLIIGLYIYYLKPSFFINFFGLKMEARNNIGNILTEKATDKILPFHFFISQFKVILHYLFIFIWPFDICVEYDWKLVHSFFSLDCFFPFLLLCAGAYLIIKQLKKDPTNLYAMGLLWFFISIAPRSSFIPSSELLTDYKTYIGSIGLTFFLAIFIIKGLTYIIKKTNYEQFIYHKQEYYIFFLLLIALPFGWATHERNKVWSSGEHFWGNIIRNAPGKARAYNNYAVALSEQGQYKESIPYYQKAIAMDSSYPDPLNNLAVAYSFIGDLDKAIAALRQSIMIQPMYPEAYNNLATFLITKKEYDQAEKALEYAIKLRPYYGKAYFNLGKVYLYKDAGMFGPYAEKAFEHFKSACTQADLDNESGFQLYGHMAMRLKKYPEAVFAYGKMVELQPNKDNIFNLAHAQFLNENFDGSIQTYEKLLRSFPAEKNAWYNLGEAYLKKNNPQKALYSFNKAKELNHTIPNLTLRIAYCHKLLNQIPQMEQLLDQVIQDSSMPEQFKIAARNELAAARSTRT